MGTVFVHLDSLNVLSVNVATYMGALVNNQHALAGGGCLLRKGCAKQSRANDKIVVFHDRFSIWLENESF